MENYRSSVLSNLRSHVDRAALKTAFKRISAMGKKVGELINKMDGLVTGRGADKHLQINIDTLTRYTYCATTSHD